MPAIPTTRSMGERIGTEIVRRALEALGQEVGGYSTGMRTRLAFARAVIQHELEMFVAAHRAQRPYPRVGDEQQVGAGVQELAHVAALAYAAPDRERDGHGRCRSIDQVEKGSAVLVGRGDVEKGDLVRASLTVALRRLDRIAGITKADEIDALHDTPVLDVETGDDSLSQHQASSRALKASDNVNAPE